MKHITFYLIAVFLFIVATVQAQNTITGYVDNYDTPLENVNIAIKGSDLGTTTHKDGSFSLEAQKGDVLVFSYVGYESVERTMANEKQMLVSFEVASLDEVMITGYSNMIKSTYCCKPKSRTTMSYRCNLKLVGFDIPKTRETPIPLTIKTYPKPSTNGIFNLDLGNNYNNVELATFNILGQRVQQQAISRVHHSISADLSSLPSGIYLINIIADGERLETQKVIKK